MPESGMGFQVFRHGHVFWVAFNATIVVLLSELRGSSAAELDVSQILATEDITPEQKTSTVRATQEPLTLEGKLPRAFSQLDLSIRDPGVGLVSPDRVSGPTRASPALTRPLAYYRFLASPRDRRVNSR